MRSVDCEDEGVETMSEENEKKSVDNKRRPNQRHRPNMNKDTRKRNETALEYNKDDVKMNQEVKKEVKKMEVKTEPSKKEPIKKEMHPSDNAIENKPKSIHYDFIAFICFKESKKIYTFGTNDATLKVNDAVVVETVRGLEVGEIVKESKAFCEVPTEMEIKPILRKATAKDLKDIENNAKAAKEAMKLCEAAINRLNLDMRLIDAEYTLDRSKIIFVYVADDRVDFRDLLKDLATQFKCRIELRQIGPRNKAKIVGGLGACGMETCCSRFMNDFDVVSINMAKNQLLALNVQKLSGQCGKLMCCLKFEDSQYKQMREGLPKMNSQIEYKGSRYRITSLNVLLKQVKIENKEDVQFLDFSELWPEIDWSKR